MKKYDEAAAGGTSTPAAPQKQTLVEETPIGLSADQMQKSNPDAVASLQQSAAQAAVTAERERIAALTETFASDPEFLKTCINDEHMTVEKAKAAKYDDVAAENQKLVSENARLKAADSQADSDADDDSNPPFVATDDDDNDAAAGDGEGGDKLAKEAARIWGASSSIRKAFGNDQAAFELGFGDNPDPYRDIAKADK